MITDSQQLLLKLLRCALWRNETIPALNPEEFEQMMFEAEQQAVSALIAERITESGAKLNVKAVARLLAILQQHKQTSLHMDTGVAQLAQLLDANNIRYVVFKGQVAAANYPYPTLRTSGDIDFYVAKRDFGRAADVIETTWNVVMERGESNPDGLHWSFSRDGISYEMHYRAEMFGTSAHQSCFDALVENDVTEGNRIVVVAGTAVRVFSKELEVLHIFKHFFHHLLAEGAGLRQLCDLCIMLNTYEDLDKKTLRKYLVELGYSRAFDATVLMAERYLRLRNTIWPISGQGLSSYADRMMHDVLVGGNFGRRNRKFHNTGLKKSMETAVTAFHHVCTCFGLAPAEIFAYSLLRIKISTRNIWRRLSAPNICI